MTGMRNAMPSEEVSGCRRHRFSLGLMLTQGEVKACPCTINAVVINAVARWGLDCSGDPSVYSEFGFPSVARSGDEGISLDSPLV